MEKMKLLVVDDSPQNIYSIKQILQYDELDVIDVNSGEEALGIVLKLTIDLILLDIQMPGMDGFEVAELLRANPKTAHIPIIFITAINRSEEIAFKGYESGAIDILFKPINRILLKSKVEVFINIVNARKKVEDQNEMLIKINQELTEAKEKISILANTDPLTKLYNRRKLGELIDKAWREGLRNSTTMSFVMIDIDDFKGYNDFYGHSKGDEVLVHVSKSIRNALHRPYDCVGRYGGEEFLVLLPNTDKEGAMSVAEDIRASVENLQIDHFPTCPFEYVTISLGVTTIVPTQDVDIIKYIDIADEAMYSAKIEGKNRTLYK